MGGCLPAEEKGLSGSWPQKERGLCRAIRRVTDISGCLACGGLQRFFPPTVCHPHVHLPHGGLHSTLEGKGHGSSVFGAGLKIMGSLLISILGRAVLRERSGVSSPPQDWPMTHLLTKGQGAHP